MYKYLFIIRDFPLEGISLYKVILFIRNFLLQRIAFTTPRMELSDFPLAG